MSNFVTFIDGLYDRLQHTWLQILSFVMAFICAGLLMWDPHAFAKAIGGFNLINALAIIWATCTGFIYGVGFKPKFWFWQLAFFPPLAWIILVMIFSLLLY